MPISIILARIGDEKAKAVLDEFCLPQRTNSGQPKRPRTLLSEKKTDELHTRLVKVGQAEVRVVRVVSTESHFRLVSKAHYQDEEDVLVVREGSSNNSYCSVSCDKEDGQRVGLSVEVVVRDVSGRAIRRIANQMAAMVDPDSLDKTFSMLQKQTGEKAAARELQTKRDLCAATALRLKQRGLVSVLSAYFED